MKFGRYEVASNSTSFCMSLSFHSTLNIQQNDKIMNGYLHAHRNTKLENKSNQF